MQSQQISSQKKSGWGANILQGLRNAFPRGQPPPIENPQLYIVAPTIGTRGAPATSSEYGVQHAIAIQPAIPAHHLRQQQPGQYGVQVAPAVPVSQTHQQGFYASGTQPMMYATLPTASHPPQQLQHTPGDATGNYSEEPQIGVPIAAYQVPEHPSLRGPQDSFIPPPFAPPPGETAGYPSAPAPIGTMSPAGYPSAPAPIGTMSPAGYPSAPAPTGTMAPAGYPSAPAPTGTMAPAGYPSAPAPIGTGSPQQIASPSQKGPGLLSSIMQSLPTVAAAVGVLMGSTDSGVNLNNHEIAHQLFEAAIGLYCVGKCFPRHPCGNNWMPQLKLLCPHLSVEVCVTSKPSPEGDFQWVICHVRGLPGCVVRSIGTNSDGTGAIDPTLADTQNECYLLAFRGTSTLDEWAGNALYEPTALDGIGLASPLGTSSAGSAGSPSSLRQSQFPGSPVALAASPIDPACALTTGFRQLPMHKGFLKRFLEYVPGSRELVPAASRPNAPRACASLFAAVQMISERSTRPRWLLCGHSLGGAMAQLAATGIPAFSAAKVITYGAPNVFAVNHLADPVAQSLLESLKLRAVHYVCRNDCVPSLLSPNVLCALQVLNAFSPRAAAAPSQSALVKISSFVPVGKLRQFSCENINSAPTGKEQKAAAKAVGADKKWSVAQACVGQECTMLGVGRSVKHHQMDSYAAAFQGALRDGGHTLL